MFSPRIELAITTAIEAHGLRRRKAGSAFEATHALSVGLIVSDFGGAENSVVAALLHDTLEDTLLNQEVIRDRFGDYVLAIVTDLTEPKKPVAWRRRKEAYIECLRQSPRDESRTVASADKIHNLSSMVDGLENQGVTFIDMFTAGLEGMVWFQREVHRMLTKEWSHPILDEHGRQLERFLLAAKNLR
ncbi:uncharacterized protein METZ01_LOCUS76035 [marine metagenome]|uniref:HD/PDEase domain-containing protein n=1 Tax=marine metagenome TaxID=408172 RepID=A0A381U600_9ZZZZ|tara:strand:+ start:65 stop:628 length:564 start_codon:yes stop_codon:yes gene_type:complete